MGKQATITGGATTIVSGDLTVSRALESDISGKVLTKVSDVEVPQELGYLSGVSSAIQTQLKDAEQASHANLTTFSALDLSSVEQFYCRWFNTCYGSRC